MHHYTALSRVVEFVCGGGCCINLDRLTGCLRQRFCIRRDRVHMYERVSKRGSFFFFHVTCAVLGRVQVFMEKVNEATSSCFARHVTLQYRKTQFYPALLPVPSPALSPSHSSRPFPNLLSNFALPVPTRASSRRTQCVSLRDTLLQDPNPYRHLNARNLPPLDAELLVSMAFSLIPHLPAEMMDEIAQHPFLEEPIQADSA